MKTFERFKYKEGDQVKLYKNPCGELCGCSWTPDKAPFLCKDVEYTVEKISHFGGGCPSVLLQLKGVFQTIENPVPANWFKPLWYEGQQGYLVREYIHR